MRVDQLLCSDDAELHIWIRHRVTPREVEDAVYQRGLVIRGRAKNIYNVFGRTEAGRYPSIRKAHGALTPWLNEKKDGK